MHEEFEKTYKNPAQDGNGKDDNDENGSSSGESISEDCTKVSKMNKLGYISLS